MTEREIRDETWRRHRIEMWEFVTKLDAMQLARYREAWENSLAGSLARLHVAVADLRVQLGAAVEPLMMELMGAFGPWRRLKIRILLRAIVVWNRVRTALGGWQEWNIYEVRYRAFVIAGRPRRIWYRYPTDRHWLPAGYYHKERAIEAWLERRGGA